MGIARNIARLIPNGSGLLPNANIEAVAASKLTGQVPDANAPPGSVIQVVQVVKTDVFSSTSGTMVDITGLSASITPISASNRIMAMITITGGSEAANNLVDFQLVRNSTAIFLGDTRSGYNRASVGGFRGVYDINGANSFGMSFVDSPATTSSTTYKLQAKCEGGTFRINTNGSNASGNVWSFTAASSIILMEIAA